MTANLSQWLRLHFTRKMHTIVIEFNRCSIIGFLKLSMAHLKTLVSEVILYQDYNTNRATPFDIRNVQEREVTKFK